MDNRWSDSLRHKMEHHGETPPEGLWDAIERGMDRRTEALSRRRRNLFWSIGSSAAAAVVALLLLINPAVPGVVDPNPNPVVAGDYHPEQPDSVTDSTADPVADTAIVLTPLTVPGAIPGAIADMTPETIHNATRDTTSDGDLKAIPDVVPEIAPYVVAPEPEPEPEKPRYERQPGPRTAPDYEQYHANNTPPTPIRKSRRAGRWQAGLYASNGAVSGSRREMDFVAQSDSPVPMFSDFAYAGNSSYNRFEHSSLPPKPPKFNIGSLTSAISNDVKHRLPVTVGVSVGHGLGERWSLTGGVTYTRLASTFKIASGLYSGSYEQVLHYIGIPLDVRFDLWRSAGGFSVYLSAGGQAAKSVAGRVTARDAVPSALGGPVREGKVNDPRVHWSVRGSAGVGYDFTPTVGLYAEPGIDYHFGNDSPVVTVWKDRSVNFGLRLGLRLSL